MSTISCLLIRRLGWYHCTKLCQTLVEVKQRQRAPTMQSTTLQLCILNFVITIIIMITSSCLPLVSPGNIITAVVSQVTSDGCYCRQLSLVHTIRVALKHPGTKCHIPSVSPGFKLPTIPSRLHGTFSWQESERVACCLKRKYSTLAYGGRHWLESVITIFPEGLAAHESILSPVSIRLISHWISSVCLLIPRPGT